MAINSSVRTVSVDSIEGIVGSKNYVKSNFESNTTSGWSLFNTTLTGGLPSGTITTGAASLALSTTATNPIEGSYSLQLTAASTATAGQGFISDVFTLQNSDLGKVINSKFSYNVVSGATNLNFSGVLGSQTIAVAFYDVTAAAWIAAPSGGLGLNQSSNYADSSPITFQSSVTVGQQYRMAVYFSQASVGAATLTFDSFICSRTIITTGAAMTDWKSYTPTWTATTTNPVIGNGALSGRWRRVGDSMEVEIEVDAGSTTTGGSGFYLFGLPTGLSIDNSKVIADTIYGSAYAAYGTAAAYDGLISNVPGVATTTQLAVRPTSGAAASAWSGTVPAAFTTQTVYHLHATVSIVGWSSNVQQSSDSDQRVITGRLENNSTSQTWNNTFPILGWDSTVFDTSGSWNNTTKTLTISSSGYYRFDSGTFLAAASFSTTASLALAIYKNGNLASYSGQTRLSNSAALSLNPEFSGSCIIQCNAGDQITFRGYSDTATTSFAFAAGNYVTWSRLSGSAVVQATESVNARYTNAASPSVPITNAALSGWVRDFDSHAAMDTNALFKAPISGKYSIKAAIRISATSLTAGQALSLVVFKNGSYFCDLGLTYSSGTVNTAWLANGSDTIALLAGETIQIQASCTVATTLLNIAGCNHVSIERVGN